MQQPPVREPSSSALWIAIVAGVGVLVLLGCVGAGAAVFLLRRGVEQASSAERARMQSELERMRAAEERARESARESTERAAAAQQEVDPAPVTQELVPDVVSVTMRVVTSTGVTGLPPGAICTFPIRRGAAENGLDCHAMVGCNGLHLYGATDTQGYFACPTFTTSPAAVIGADTATTGEDQDASFAIDTQAGTVTIADDARGALGAFRVTGTVTAATVRRPTGGGYGS